VEPETPDSSPYLQQHTTGSYPEPAGACTPVNFPKIHSDPILPSTPWSSKRYLSFGLPYQNFCTFLLSPMRALCPAHLILLELIFVMIFGHGTKYEAVHCATSSIVLLVRLCLGQIFKIMHSFKFHAFILLDLT
jgi:hypothetical protein